MNESFEDLFKAEETKKIRRLTPGQKVTATVVGTSTETIFLDVGGKSEGVLNSSELMDKEGNLSVSLGDQVDVYFLQAKSSEQLFTTKIGSGSNIAHLEEAWRSRIPVEGTVQSEIKGGFEITLGGSVRAFCPFSQMSLRRVEDPAAEYVGKTMLFLITKIEESGRNIVISGRAVEESSRAELREKLIDTLKEGETIEGEVTSIQDFGAFVDIGGVDGLIPISEIGWSRVEKVADHFSIGQKVQVVVKSINWENDRISLSYKATLQDPWDETIQQCSEGTIHTGKVVRITPFGAFVSLSEGVDGLIHISKLGAGRRINHPREVLEVDQTIEVRVESIDREKRKISLAPTDYVSAESEEETERASYKKYTEVKRETSTSNSSLGNLGQLLQAKLTQKNKGK